MTVLQESLGLHLKLKDFLAEVDAISVFCRQPVTSAPVCEWTVQVNPLTQLPIYRHINSGETQTEMPDEYKRYLSEFDEYLQMQESPSIRNKAQSVRRKRKHSSGRQTSLCKSKQSVATKTIPEIGCNEYSGVPGIISYSDSSEDEDALHPDDLSPRLVGTASQQCVPEKNVSRDTSPQPVSDRGNNSIGSKLSHSFQPDTVLVDPVIPSTKSDSQHDPESAPPNPLDTKESSMLNKTKRKQNLFKKAEAMMNKLSSGRIDLSNIGPLSVLFLQLATRFEDWQSGMLPTDKFAQLLKQMKTEMLNYMVSDVSFSWRCHWSWKSKRLYKTYLPCTGQLESAQEIRPAGHTDVITVDENQETTSTDCRTSICAEEARVKLVDYESPKKTNSQLNDDPTPSCTPNHCVASPHHPLTNCNGQSADDIRRRRAEHLNAQLAEFELACQQLERELNASHHDLLDPSNQKDGAS
ncbi:hypothetical protein PHET_08622 [Paragonimus heterotremus]|uniref:Uncharacterized protein n=1 Tax=Paragonimus heterotremus TaxID=100268 RepID=A0A8J4T6A5_9TREM|nr:hypothetical protein PHET_08622 [Paragonimus heterotremus]